MELRRRHGGTIVLLGGERERGPASEIAATVGPPVLDLTGRTSLGVLGAVIMRLAVLITNDSGPAQIAYALNTPSITIFGGTDPAEWGPLDGRRHAVLAYDVPCRPCTYSHCPIGSLCLDGASVGSAIGGAEHVMRDASGAGRAGIEFDKLNRGTAVVNQPLELHSTP